MSDHIQHTNGFARFFRIIKKWFYFQFKLTNSHTIKLYDGFGNEKQCRIHGHAFSLLPLTRRNYRKGFLFNSLALIRLFMVKPLPNALVRLEWEQTTYETETQTDGFFKFEWNLSEAKPPGQYRVTVKLINRENGFVKSTSEAQVFIPFPNQYHMISDIDDTFLISYSAHLLKRLYVLLTKNAHSRKPFDGVVRHYSLLKTAGTMADFPNPFFYVSSSEWNLYDYIKTFCLKNGMPKGTFHLNQIKTFSRLLKTGQNNHDGKFFRIVRIVETYPHQKFILLGDDSQQDPVIYSSIVSHFEEKIHCVYIRAVGKKKKPETERILADIQLARVHCCYFLHSEEAIKHSVRIGLVEEA